MFTRCLKAPQRSFFLFGPRGTGKTTWLRTVFPKARWFNLLKQADILPLMREPELFGNIVEALPPPHWIVIDEVQKLPSILDEVHEIISRHGTRYRFALSGSSARKLRRLNVNLLAGRVIRRNFFPLTLAELGGKRCQSPFPRAF